MISSEANSGALDFFFFFFFSNFEVVTLALKWLTPCGALCVEVMEEKQRVDKEELRFFQSSAMSRHFVSLSRRYAV